MDARRVAAIRSAAGHGSGYVVAPRLVLTSAHATPSAGGPVTLFTATDPTTYRGRVVWRDESADAALVDVDDDRWPPPPGAAPGWGRIVTNRPGIAATAWGWPDLVQREGRPAEVWQASGTIDPGRRFVGDRYVLGLAGPPPAGGADGSPWAGLSGAAVFSGDLLVGVVAADLAGGRHAHLEVVPAYVLHPALAEQLGPVELQPVELQPLAEIEPPVGRSPAALLRARQQVVAFQGRAALMDDLSAWAAGPGFAATLLHGPGGHGKTRVAQELARRLTDERWATVWLRRDASDLTVLADVAVPLLVVVDYAETRPDQVAAALRASARHGGGSPLRFLLLARTAGDWWSRLRSLDPQVEAMLDGATERALAPEPVSYRDALEAYAAALSLEAGPADRALPADAPALTVHMTALADLVDGGAPGPVEDRLLRHESRYWRAAATARGLLPALAEDTLIDALAAATLLGADHREEADAVLSRLPALADQPRDRRDALRAWIGALYPSGDHRPWVGPQPDRLAERFVGERLARTPDLVDPVLAAATSVQIGQLLTVYARAAHHRPDLGSALTELTLRHPDALAAPAVDVVTRVEAPEPLLRALDRLVRDDGTPVRLLEPMSDRIPLTSDRLADWAVDLAARLVAEFRRPGAEVALLASWLNTYAIRLSEVGRREDALAAAEEAVDAFRVLAAAHPHVYLDDLAMALNNLSNRLAQLGQREAALAAIEEAAGAYRELGADHRLALAVSLNNMTGRLAGLGRHREALAVIEEATAIWRELPDAYRADLARSLNNRSNVLADLGRPDDALAAIEEATQAYRELAETRPDEFRPDLAIALNNLGNHLAGVGRFAEALAAAEESTAIRRRLASARPDAFAADLAMSLNNLSVILSELGRPADALPSIEEAVAIRRRQAAARPDAFAPDLASALNNWSVRLAALGRDEEALAPAEEALRGYRSLATARPDAFRPDLAIALNNLSNRLGALGRHEEALAAIEEAVAIRRELAARRPEAYNRVLVTSLTNLVICLLDLGREDEARAVAQEADEIAARSAP